MFTLLCDKNHYSQVDISEKVGTSQPAVSMFISYLAEKDMIEQSKDKDGTVIYQDKYGLMKFLGKGKKD